MNNRALTPAKLPREIKRSTVMEMEPGERGIVASNAIFVDRSEKVWIDAAGTLFPEAEGNPCCVRIVRKAEGAHLTIPDCWRFARNTAVPKDAVLIPVLNIEVTPCREEDFRTESA